MIDDTLDLDEADSELEDEADEEVDKVLYELTDGKLGMAGTVKDSLPVSFSRSSSVYGGLDQQTDIRTFRKQAAQQKEEEEADINTEAEMQRMQRELQDLLTG